MKDLLPYFERELTLIRQGGAEFAARFPGPASRLGIMRESCSDPHVERTIQATALLAARVSKSLEDSYPQLTESFLEVLFPHYLRPFPSCAIVNARSTDTQAPASGKNNILIARGTELRSPPVDGVSCRFRTCYDIRQMPVRVAEARFVPSLAAPHSVRVPQNCSAGVDIVIEITAPDAELASTSDTPLRIYIDGDASLAAITRDTLCGRVVAAYVEAGMGTWSELARVPVSPVGFSDDDVLVPFSPRSHPAYRLLAEYFTFPEKFNFIDLDVASMARHVPARSRRITLHFAIADMRSDSHEARLLSTLSPANFVLGCSPVVNLFRHTAVPISITHEVCDYPLLPDAEHARAFDIHTVDSVQMLRRRDQGLGMTTFAPFYSLQHGDDGADKGHYYVVRRDDNLARYSAGHEYKIAFVDADFDPATSEQATVSIELTCSNRDLPTRLEHARAGGDLATAEGEKASCEIMFVRRPTPPYRFAPTPALQWRLVSHLSLNFQSLVQEGLDGFREMLALYDLAQSQAVQRQIKAIVGLSHRPTTAWMRDKRGASLVHGIEVRITVDEEGFAGSGLHLFARVIDQFLSLYVQINSFTELVVLSSKSAKELIRCKPRNGDLYLV